MTVNPGPWTGPPTWPYPTRTGTVSTWPREAVLVFDTWQDAIDAAIVTAGRVGQRVKVRRVAVAGSASWEVAWRQPYPFTMTNTGTHLVAVN